MHTNNKMATDDDVYDVVLASSCYLYSSGEFSRRRNRQTRPLRFWVYDVLRRRDDLAEYARLVQELRLGSDSFQRYFRLSTLNRAVGLCSGLVRVHTFYVYQLCTWLCMCMGCTASYDVRSVNAALRADVLLPNMDGQEVNTTQTGSGAAARFHLIKLN